MSVRALQEALGDHDLAAPLTQTTTTSVATADGTVAVVAVEPAKLAERAGVPLETYSLARVVRSEGYSGAAIGKAAAAVAIGQAVRNGAGSHSITAKLVHSSYPAASGFYGEQRGRYASTRLDPTGWHAQVAAAVLERAVPDLARSATMFLAPHVYVGGTQAGRPLGPFDVRMRKWHSIDQEGYDQAWVGHIATVDAGHLMLFHHESSVGAREASYKASLRIFEDVLAGKNRPAPGDPDAGGGLLVAALLALGALSMVLA